MNEKPYSIKPFSLHKTALSGPNGLIEVFTPIAGEDKFWCAQLNAAFDAGTRFAAATDLCTFVQRWLGIVETPGEPLPEWMDGFASQARAALAKASPANGGAK